jgi:colanic acid biosynthesis glycosyl transferase WcaI
VRILILVLQFPPDVNTTGALVEQLANGLTDRGHSVSVITSFPHYEKFRIWDQYRGKLFERSGSILRLWVHANGGKNNMLNRLLSYLSFNVLATIFGLLTREQYDVILCPNGGFFTGIAGAIIGMVKRAPFVYNVQDLYPETPVQAGQLRNPLAIAGLQKLESMMYRAAAHVSVITPSFQTNIVGKGIDDEKVSVIPNFVDSEFIRPLQRHNEFSKRHGLDDKFVVTHAGNLGYVYDLETLLDAAALIKSWKALDDIVFLIVGDGVVRERLIMTAASLELDNVRFLPFQPRASLPLLRASSDVQLALYRTASARFSMPSKVYEIMASGRPVLASAEADSDLARLVVGAGAGVCVSPKAQRQLADAIVRLRSDAALRREMGERGRAAVERTYSRDVVVTQYDELLRAIGNRSREGKRPWESRPLQHVS